jgi:Tol biopolymer transport system component
MGAIRAKNSKNSSRSHPLMQTACDFHHEVNDVLTAQSSYCLRDLRVLRGAILSSNTRSGIEFEWKENCAMYALRVVLAAALCCLPVSFAENGVVAPNENLELTNIPPIPERIADAVDRYGHTRYAGFDSWHPTDRAMLIGTRFADTSQVHHVAEPGGARRQLTFFNEPVGWVAYQPTSGNYFCFSRDTGGGEFYQNYRFDPDTGETTLLTDGEKRNGSGIWSNSGRTMAYSRVDADENGAFTQLRIVPPLSPDRDRLVVRMDGGGWRVADWSPDDGTLLVVEYLSINESYLWRVDADTGSHQRLTNPPDGLKVAYSGGEWAKDGKGIYATTDISGEFRQLHTSRSTEWCIRI